MRELNTIYNILWIDDELAGDMQRVYNAAIEDYKDSLKICGVNDLIQFKEHFYDYIWDAIIFDINNRMDINDTEENSGGRNIFGSLLFDDDRLEYINEYKIPIFAFSGILDNKGTNETTEIKAQLKGYGFQQHPRTGDYYWDKSPKGDNEYQDSIFKDVIEYLDNCNQKYIGHEYLLNIFEKKWLEPEVKTVLLDPIMEKYHKKDYISTHGNEMRQFAEQMLTKINNIYKLVVPGTKGWAANVARQIKNKKLSYSEFASGSLVYLIENANSGSHNIGEVQEQKLLFDMDYNAFLYSCYWFNKIMTRIEENSSVDNAEENDSNVQVQENENDVPKTVKKSFEKPKLNDNKPSFKLKNYNGEIRLKLFGKNKKYINDDYVYMQGVIVYPNNYKLLLKDDE